MSDCEGEEEQFDSALGTKEFWDQRYNLELSNFTENGDEGEVWFGRSAENRVIKFLSEQKVDKDVAILDVGTGNGSMLRRLREKGFTKLTGIDYSEGAIELSKELAEQDDYDGDVEIEFLVTDLIKEESDEELRNRFDVILDKGTWDAISLAGDRNERLKNYRNSIVSFLRQNDMADIPLEPRYFVICSCNFTKDELIELFQCEDLQFDSEVAASHSISFGGRCGVTSTVVVFRKD
uniref:Protein-lysine N-methyltransferase n=1 Tax=Steinernema glaseri TaxID=37863 RepID=A0A1I7Y742_9BILA